MFLKYTAQLGVPTPGAPLADQAPAPSASRGPAPYGVLPCSQSSPYKAGPIPTPLADEETEAQRRLLSLQAELAEGRVGGCPWGCMTDSPFPTH